jgi:hypothetical protein
MRTLTRFLNLLFALFFALLIWQAGWLSEPRAWYTLDHLLELAALGALILWMLYRAFRSD